MNAARPVYYAVDPRLCGYIVTACADGSVPIGAGIVARLDDMADDPLTPAVRLCAQANAAPAMADALYGLLKIFADYYGEPSANTTVSEQQRAGRAALAAYREAIK